MVNPPTIAMRDVDIIKMNIAMMILVMILSVLFIIFLLIRPGAVVAQSIRPVNLTFGRSV